MIGLLAGRDIALGYEIEYLLPGQLIDIQHEDAERPAQGFQKDLASGELCKGVI